MHKTSLEFEHQLWLKMEAYCKAIGARTVGIVRIAVEKYIDDELDQNPGMKVRYEKYRSQLLAAAGNNIALIGNRRKSRKKQSETLNTEASIEHRK